MDVTVLAEVATGVVAVGAIAFALTKKKSADPSAAREFEAPSAPASVVRSAPVKSVDDVSPAVQNGRPDVSATEVAPLPVASEQHSVEAPESVSARSLRLRDRFGKAQGGIAQGFKSFFSASSLDDSVWQDLEDSLIMADLGARSAAEVIDRLKKVAKQSGVSSASELRPLVERELIDIVDGGFDRSLRVDRKDDAPAVVLTVGVNGTGKTTTTGKLARLLTALDKDVVLGAADTFRAAAADQLTTWGDRVGAPVVRGPEGGDPASVAFDAVQAGIDGEVDVVLIDTAGRLHTKQGLMDELGKVYRVAGKNTSIDEVLLVIDATTGQNGLTQAKVFSEVVPVTGVVLSKLDGTAKGGIVVAVQNELHVPVKLVGLGEGPDDLAVFDPAEFVAGLLG